MAALSIFLPLISPFVPGAPDIAMENAALMGAQEFCWRTLTLQRTLAPVLTVAAQANYTLTQAGEVVHKLLAVKLDGKPLDLLVASQLDGDDSASTAQTPDGALLAGPMTLRLDPTPTAADQVISVRAAMSPSASATTIDDAVAERHRMAIANYACYWLLSQPNAAYADARAAGTKWSLFLDAVAQEGVRVMREHARSYPRPRVLWC